MTKLEHKQRSISIFLLSVYLMMQAVGALHVHSLGHEAVVCHDCVEHVKHNGHIGMPSFMDVDCVLCKIIHTDYTPAKALTLTVAVLMVVVLVMQPTLNVDNIRVSLPSLRAPPVIG